MAIIPNHKQAIDGFLVSTAPLRTYRCNQCRILVLPQDHLLAYSFRVELGWQIFYCGKNKFRKWDVAQTLAFPINPEIPVKFLTRKTHKKSSKWCLFILGIARSTRAFSVVVFNYKPNPHPSHWVCPWVELWDKIHTYFHNQMNAKACSWAINWEIQKFVIGQSNNFSLKSKSSWILCLQPVTHCHPKNNLMRSCKDYRLNLMY